VSIEIILLHFIAAPQTTENGTMNQEPRTKTV